MGTVRKNTFGPLKHCVNWDRISFNPGMHNLEIASKSIVTQVELERRLRGLVQLFHFAEKETEAQWDQIQLEAILLVNGKAWHRPRSLTPCPFTPGGFKWCFCFGIRWGNNVKIIEYKKILCGHLKFYRLVSLAVKLSFTTKFLAQLGVEHWTASGPLLLGSFLLRPKRLEAHFPHGAFK